MHSGLAGIGARPGGDSGGGARRVLEGGCALFQTGRSGSDKLCFMCDVPENGIGGQHPGEVEDKEKGNSKDRQHQSCFNKRLTARPIERSKHVAPDLLRTGEYEETERDGLLLRHLARLAVVGRLDCVSAFYYVE